MNKENLRPFNTMPPEEHRELSRRGGIASGERRRYLADLRLEMIEALAAKKAVADFEEGRISATEVDNQKRKYIKELTTRAKSDAVMGERINAALRGTR